MKLTKTVLPDKKCTPILCTYKRNPQIRLDSKAVSDPVILYYSEA